MKYDLIKLRIFHFFVLSLHRFERFIKFNDGNYTISRCFLVLIVTKKSEAFIF